MKNKKTLSWFLGVLMIFMLGVFSFSTAYAGWSVESLATYTLPGATIGDIIKTIANWLVGMFGFFGLIGFIVSGIMYLVSAGNEEMIGKAKKYMMYSMVGVIVGLSGYVIIKAMDALLRANSF